MHLERHPHPASLAHAAAVIILRGVAPDWALAQARGNALDRGKKFARSARGDGQRCTIYANRQRCNTGTMQTVSQRLLPFKKALLYARSLDLKGKVQWEEWSQSGARPENIPSNPSVV